jgi:predicted kinase
MNERPVLISIGGLPATGKTTIARLVASHLRAAYLRVDTIETAIAQSQGVHEASHAWETPPGYVVGRAVAADQLRVGVDVVAESVNAYDVTRDGWRDVAQKQGARLLEVEIVCSDAAEHRRRAEQRELDIPGMTGPTWSEIVDRDYQPWSRDRLIIDTAVVGAAAGASAIEAVISGSDGGGTS